MQLGSLSDLLEEEARANHVPGGQLTVFHHGETWAFPFGQTEHRGGVGMTAEDRVPIGSITKTFTATLAMLLVSDGDLELDAPVVEYLPELRRLSADRATNPANRLTPRHLLSHTGGLAAECTGLSAGRQGWSRWFSSVQPPGTGFSYSNLGYALVGRLVEAVTGVTWWEAMRDILLKPLGITPAFVATPDCEPAGAYVPGHAVNRATHRIRVVEQALEPVEAPAGALALSANDLVTLARTHLRPEHGGTDDGLVAPDELAEMRRPAAHAEPFGLANGWGLGLALFRAGSTTWFGHDGTADGTSCHLRIDPESGTVAALTTNASTGNSLWQRIAAELDIGDYTAPAHTKHRTPPPRDSAGSYHNGDIEYTVNIRGNDVQLVVDDEPTARLVPHEGLIFSIIDLSTGELGRPGRFLRNSRGYIDRVQIGGRVARRQHRAQEVA